jgi:hypothetical protein
MKTYPNEQEYSALSNGYTFAIFESTWREFIGLGHFNVPFFLFFKKKKKHIGMLLEA